MNGMALVDPNTATAASSEALCREFAATEQAFAEIWPDCPIVIDADEICELDPAGSTDIINCLLTFSIERDQKPIVILNAQDLLSGREGHSPVECYSALKSLFNKAAAQAGIRSPRLKLRQSGDGIDLHVALREGVPTTGNVVSLAAERRRRRQFTPRRHAV